MHNTIARALYEACSSINRQVPSESSPLHRLEAPNVGLRGLTLQLMVVRLLYHYMESQHQ
jgi:hypothetical protein